MTQFRPLLLLAGIAGLAVVAGCAEEAPPRTVTEFVDDTLLLEAVLLRCTENRRESRYEAECVNAREAVKRIEAREVAARRAELEVESERKREALRRTQQAAAEARRRSAAAAQQREELEYQAQFGLSLPSGNSNNEAMLGNEAGVIIPAPQPEAVTGGDVALPAAGSNAPVAVSAQPVATPAGAAPLPAQPVATPPPQPGLDDIRREMRRRNEEQLAGGPE